VNLTGIRIGMSMVMFGCALMITWGATVATQTRRGPPATRSCSTFRSPAR
jgi:hypothetical protein